MTLTALGLWMAAHSAELGATLVVLSLAIPSIMVAGKEKPLPGEGRLPFFWRVWGRLAFTTFRNVGTVWGLQFKLPGAPQPESYVLPGLDIEPRQVDRPAAPSEIGLVFTERQSPPPEPQPSAPSTTPAPGPTEER